jgi:WD40 repeat protein
MQDFVSAVMDVDYSPTGREFVAGSYDRSVRIFGFNAGHSREVGRQHTLCQNTNTWSSSQLPVCCWMRTVTFNHHPRVVVVFM